ncbi:hypothetical protein B4Q04_10880 [Zobellia sp. OII3]|uniref:hypothetical protein n=1 Tax=Zobellia sp. OII3 TaxID=2034520 RepID=UPI000B52DC28|nr:hypothetical protein [Zobellia sp. OII3]OWW25045.1 hypothetical protein B4Q04_10880 [Zobellia sp. OII3]
MGNLEVSSEKIEDLRLDYSKYEVDELVETVSDAVFFPLYIAKVVGSVLLTVLVVLFVLTVYGTYHWFTGFLFFVIALVVTMPSVILFSVIRLFSTIKSDLEKVYAITLDTALHVYDDANKLKEQRTNNVALKYSFVDVFKGVALYVIRPTLKGVLSKRIKWFALPFTWLIDIIFKKIFLSKSAQAALENEDMANEEESGKETGERDTNGIGAKIVNATFITLKFPFRLALMLYGIVNSFIIWVLIYLL